MIHLASDPNASRMDWRPTAPAEAKRSVQEERRLSRGGHPWPFISRYGEQKAALEAPARAESDSKGGS